MEGASSLACCQVSETIAVLPAKTSGSSIIQNSAKTSRYTVVRIVACMRLFVCQGRVRAVSFQLDTAFFFSEPKSLAYLGRKKGETVGTRGGLKLGGFWLPRKFVPAMIQWETAWKHQARRTLRISIMTLFIPHSKYYSVSLREQSQT